MTFKIAWMYYDLLDLYGDRGNIIVLKKILEINNINVQIDQISLNDQTAIADHDLIFLGGGTDYAQNLLANDLMARKPQILQAIDNGAFFLMVCGGYQMFGEYYLDTQGNKVPGLNIFNHYTVGGENRCIGNVVANTKLGEKDYQIIGFENHGGQTKNVESPFAKMIYGNGNAFASEFEGTMTDFFIGTYFHGSLLPKNPEIAKYMIETVLERKYQFKVDLKLPFQEYTEKARQAVLDQLKI
ncbi:MAG: type 1 glutamine amidotransferase [Mycoplasmatales bacterium]